MASSVTLRNIRGRSHYDIYANIRETALRYFGLEESQSKHLGLPNSGFHATQQGETFIVDEITVSYNPPGMSVGVAERDSEQVVQSYSDRPDVQHITTRYSCTCEDYRYRKLGTALTCKHQRDEFGFGQFNALLFPVAFLDELRHSRKIQAIKFLRDANSGMSLNEAKDHTDAYAKHGDLT